MTKTIGITDQQESYIATLSRKAGFDSPQEACKAAGISSRNWRYDLSRHDASDLIDQLKKGLAPEPEPEPIPAGTVEGVPTAEQAIALLGRRVKVITLKGAPLVGRVEAIVPSAKDGTPALRIEGGDRAPRFSVIHRIELEQE